MKTLRLEDLAATEAIGTRLGRALRAGDCVGLSGPLGAGKTALVRAIAAGAGVSGDEVTSPTFSLINTYRAAFGPLHHADLYRLESRDELYATGYFDLLDAEGAVLVEWIERVPGAAPRDWLELTLAPVEGAAQARDVTAVSHGPRSALLAEAMIQS